MDCISTRRYVRHLCVCEAYSGHEALGDGSSHSDVCTPCSSMAPLGGGSVTAPAARVNRGPSGGGELRCEECAAWPASWTWRRADYSGVRILHTTSWHPAEGVWRGPPFGSIGHLIDVANFARSDSQLRQPRGRGGVERFGGLRILRFILRTPAHTVRRTLNCLRYHSTL